MAEPGQFQVSVGHEQHTERSTVTFAHHDRALVLHFESWSRSDGGAEYRNSGFSFATELEPGDERDGVTAEMVQRLVDEYPYWLNIAREALRYPLSTFPDRTLTHGRWKPSQPGRSAAFLEQVAEEYVRRFDAGENAVTEIARAHGVTPGTVSKWLTKGGDPRVSERRANRYRRSS
jgi:hypothetical protein